MQQENKKVFQLNSIRLASSTPMLGDPLGPLMSECTAQIADSQKN